MSRAGVVDILFYIESPAEVIATQRRALGLSQRSLARRAGCTQAALSRIEQGLSSPRWSTLRALLLAMGLEPELTPRRMEGRWDDSHLSAMKRRTPSERLELAMSANRLAGRLREAARQIDVAR